MDKLDFPRPKFTKSKDCVRKKKQREKLWNEWAWQGSTQGWALSGVEEEEPDEAVGQSKGGQRSKPEEEAASLSAQPNPDLFHPGNTQPPVGGIQPGLPSEAPILSYGVFPDSVSMPRGTFNTLQGGSGMNSGTYDVKPLTSLERARLPIFSGHMRDTTTGKLNGKACSCW